MSVLTAGGCSAPPDVPPGYITVAITSSPNNLDPRIGTDEVSQKIHQLLYASLVHIDDHLRPVPALAASIQQPDPLTYLVRIRQGVRFHDGRLLTARDVAYTFQSFLDPHFVSGRKGAYRLLESVAEVDPLTVRFRLKEPFGSFLVNLEMGIVPAPAAGQDPTSLALAPIGAGPYRFVKAAADDRVVLEAAPGYVDGPPRNAGIVLKVVPDDTMRGLELRKGTVDLVVNDLAPDIVHQLAHDPRLQSVRAPGTDYAYIGLNLRDPILRDVRVRRALAMAIDRRAIVDHLRRGLAQTATGILPPASWAFEPEAVDLPHDPQEARQLLDQAGYPDPDGDGPRPRFALTLKVSSAEFYRLQAAVIQQDLRRVGVGVDIRSQEFATLYADVLGGRFQLYSMVWVGVTDPDMLRRVFHSGQVPPYGFNRVFFSDSRVDALIDAATRSGDVGERRRLYGSAQKLIAEAVPYISLWHRTNVVVARADLEGLALSPIADFRFLRHVRRVVPPDQ